MGKTAADLAVGLGSSFDGVIVTPSDIDYNDVRRIHNGAIDKRPALIARCRSTNDVSVAIVLARDEGLEVSVRGGGHNVAGKAVTDGGVMIDLSLMKHTTVDVASATARTQGGVIWREYNDATGAHALASTGGVISTTGVAGLTLGGGLGWLMSSRGLAIDNLLAADVVLANGDVAVASEATDPDLFWAIRGGGGNFGVVTSFSFALRPLETVLGGLAAHMIDAAPGVFRLLRDAGPTLSDDIVCTVGLTHAPDESGMQICGLGVCHSGPDHDAAAVEVQPLRSFGPPPLDLIERMPYPVINTILDDGFQKGSQNYWKSAFFAELTDEAIDIMVDQFRKCPTTMCGLLVEHIHGAATRVPVTATAFPHRAEGFNLVIIAQWTEPIHTDACVAWARETYELLTPYMAPDVYVNYLGADEGDRVRAAYGPNYERLAELKGRYDPDNLFRLNQNIPPRATSTKAG